MMKTKKITVTSKLIVFLIHRPSAASSPERLALIMLKATLLWIEIFKSAVALKYFD